MTEATLGVDKDKKVVVYTRGPRNMVQHLARLKHAVREFDNAWHDVDKNVMVTFSSYRIVSNLDFIDIYPHSPRVSG
jgi:hypothetical protein